MNTPPQDTSAEEPDGGNPHIRFRGGPGRGNQPGLLNRWTDEGAHRLAQVRVADLNGELSVQRLAALAKMPGANSSYARQAA